MEHSYLVKQKKQRTIMQGFQSKLWRIAVAVLYPTQHFKMILTSNMSHFLNLSSHDFIMSYTITYMKLFNTCWHDNLPNVEDSEVTAQESFHSN